jgi:transcriptional regulator with XRE-family HTH domain
MTWQNLRRQIRSLRRKRGLTREQLADQAGVSAVYVKKLEAGERGGFLPTLDRIARTLNATLRVDIVPQKTRRRGRS